MGVQLMPRFCRSCPPNPVWPGHQFSHVLFGIPSFIHLLNSLITCISHLPHLALCPAWCEAPRTQN